MEKLLIIRNKWDELYNINITKYSIRIIGVICTYLSVYGLLQLTPFGEVINKQVYMLIPIILAIIFFINAKVAVFVFGLMLWISLSGDLVLVALFAGGICWFSCGCSRINCLLSILTPLFLINIEGETSSLLSLGYPYFIFVIGLYFANKVDNNTWKYLYAVYFSLLAFYFGVYGKVISDYFVGTWDVDLYSDMDIFTIYLTYADYDNAAMQLSEWVLPLTIILFINILISYIVKSLLNIKSIKFLNMSIDIREAIVFAFIILLVIFSEIIIQVMSGMNAIVSIPSIILQISLAYLITRPFASDAIINRLRDKAINANVYNIKNSVKGIPYFRTIDKEIKDVIETYIDNEKYENIVRSDNMPIKSILVFGAEDLDKTLVIHNILDKLNLNIIYGNSSLYIQEYKKSSKVSIFEEIGEKKSFCIVVIDEIENIFKEYNEKDIVEYFNAFAKKCKDNKNVLFILISSHPERINDDYFKLWGIGKICHASLKDSVLLKNTYRLLRPIGKGGAGLVYKAYHERLGVDVIVKKILNDFPGKGTYKTEANILKKLKHTYLPKVYDVFEENKEFYTVMDYVPGSSIQEKINEGIHFSERDVLKWGLQLLDVVEYLHKQEIPIIHSDIKPGNIILRPEGNINLIDFNISLLFNKNNNKGIGVSPGYAPIEQYGSLNGYYKILEERGVNLRTIKCKKINRYDEDPEATVLLDADEKMEELTENDIEKIACSGLSERSDIYSIGATLYSMLTGKIPSVNFFDIKPISFYNNDISIKFIKVIEKSMCVDPQNRYDTVGEMKSALKKLNYSIK